MGSVLGDAFAARLDDARHGDGASFAALWRELQPPVLRYLGVAAGSNAEDLASETWVRVASGIHRFHGDEAGFRAWVFTIARHRLLDWRRREGRSRTVATPVEQLRDRGAADDPAADAMERLSTDAALALIAQLPADQAEVVMLRAVAGLDVTRVAARCGEAAGRGPGPRPPRPAPARRAPRRRHPRRPQHRGGNAMSLDDGLFDEMRRRHEADPATPMRLDEATATRLLAGRLEPADAPPGYGTVTAVLRAAAAPPRPEELAGEDAVRDTFRARRPPGPPPRRALRRTRLAVLLAAGVVLLGGVAAAASTGSLPGPAQSLAHDALDTLGVSVPAPHPTPPPTRIAPARGPSTRRVPVTTGPAPVRPVTHPPARHPPAPAHPSAPPRSVPPRASAPGLATAWCRAAAAGHLNPHGSPPMQHAYQALVQLAGGAANIPGYCRAVLTPG